jgi:membrane-anchored glycerophosphoryl diester phosphodiesterase (GDPDase)
MALESDCKKYIYQIKHQYDKITTLYTCTLHLVLGQ